MVDVGPEASSYTSNLEAWRGGGGKMNFDTWAHESFPMLLIDIGQWTSNQRHCG